MNESVAAKIKALFAENEEFRKEFATNTKAICEKYGVDLSETECEYRKASDAVPGLSKCVIVNITGTTDGFLICDF